MKSIRTLPVLICMFGAWSLSCGNDPMTPSGTYTPPSYEPTLEGLNGPVRGVCGTSASDVYAISTAILHFDGTSWSPVELPAGDLGYLESAVSFPDGELFVSDGYDVFHLREGMWSDTGLHQYTRGMWGSAPDDLFAFSNEQLLHFDGNSWEAVSLPPLRLNAISGNAAGDVVATGIYGLVLRRQGGVWTETYIDSTINYYEVAVTGSGRTFVSGGGYVEEVVGSVANRLETGLNDPHLCADGDEIYVVGRDYVGGGHLVKRFAGGDWTQVTLLPESVNEMWVRDGEVFAAFHDGTLWHSRGTDGGMIDPFPSHGEIFDAVGIDGAAYLIGERAYRYENGTWTDLNKEDLTFNTAFSIHGQTRNDIYAVGSGMVIHYDGARWTWLGSGMREQLRSVWAEPGGGFVATAGNTLVEFDGREWKKTDLPHSSDYLLDVWGIDGVVMAVGYDGLIVMRNGDEWNVIPPPTYASLIALWGTDKNHVYALSTDSSEICFYDGRSWEAMRIDDIGLDGPRSLWGTSSSNFFILDGRGRLAHFDGSDWSLEKRLFTVTTTSLCPAGRNEVVTAGHGGVAIYRK